MTDGSEIEVDNPAHDCRTRGDREIEEPVITAMILTTEEYVGRDPEAGGGEARRRRKTSSTLLRRA